MRATTSARPAVDRPASADACRFFLRRVSCRQALGTSTSIMPFLQTAPVLSNQYLDDRVLRSYLRRVLPPAMLHAIEGDLTDLGEYAANAWTLARSREPSAPKLTHLSAWGERIDRVELTPAWTAAQPLAAKHGLVAAGHEPTHGAAARVHQF